MITVSDDDEEDDIVIVEREPKRPRRVPAERVIVVDDEDDAPAAGALTAAQERLLQRLRDRAPQREAPDPEQPEEAAAANVYTDYAPRLGDPFLPHGSPLVVSKTLSEVPSPLQNPDGEQAGSSSSPDPP